MKKYKENEDSKSAFFEEQKKSGHKPAEKKLFGPATETKPENSAVSISRVQENEVVNDAANVIFNAPGDLVLERKQQQQQAKEAAKEEETK
jgi:hypothetical protein